MATRPPPPQDPSGKDRQYEARIAELERKLAAAEKAAAAQQAAQQRLQASHAAEIEKLGRACEARLAALRDHQASELATLQQAHSASVAALKEQAGKLAASHEAELNRLNLERAALEDRLLKLIAEQDRLRAQISDITARLASAANADPRLAELEQALKLARAQNDQFLAENRRLADALELATADARLFHQHAETANAQQEQGIAKAREQLKGEYESRLSTLGERLRLAEAQAGSLAAQLAGDGRLAVIAPDQIGDLTSRFISQIENSLPGLRLSQGELKLKLGLAQSGGQTGFVVVGPNAPSTLKDQLHDFSLKFDRTIRSDDAALLVPAAEPEPFERLEPR